MFTVLFRSPVLLIQYFNILFETRSFTPRKNISQNTVNIVRSTVDSFPYTDLGDEEKRLEEPKVSVFFATRF
jgi:hypothetical protein